MTPELSALAKLFEQVSQSKSIDRIIIVKAVFTKIEQSLDREHPQPPGLASLYGIPFDIAKDDDEATAMLLRLSGGNFKRIAVIRESRSDMVDMEAAAREIDELFNQQFKRRWL
jgi:hypothetical protein